MRRNDTERRAWVMNDEALYELWRAYDVSRFKNRVCGITTFIRENRKEIDIIIYERLNRSPA